MVVRDFRELRVWEKGHRLTLLIYEATRGFPSRELYGLTAQLRHCSASIPAKIAAGCGRSGDAELGRFILISMGSASSNTSYFSLGISASWVPKTTKTSRRVQGK